MADVVEVQESLRPLVPPPLEHSETTEAAALAALAKKRSFWSRLGRRRNKKPPISTSTESLQEPFVFDDDGAVDITLDDLETPAPSSSALNVLSVEPQPQIMAAGRRGKDVYEWVTLYENQRGLTFFSTPYYSSAGLLPFDPAPFTVSLPLGSLATHPRTLPDKELFQLPDPTWRWVSKWWMIDMRSDGAVQWDGFEYNWLFQRARWRPRVGHLSAGGFVRRRRWVRLMVRPAAADELMLNGSDDTSSIPLVSEPDSSPESGEGVWFGDDEDWERCVRTMKVLVRDGRKLEVWRAWLGVVVSRERRQQWTEDGEGNPDTSPFIILSQDARPPIRQEWLLQVLKAHAVDILHLFIFPDSRAQFLELLLRAGLGDRLSDTGIFKDNIDFYNRPLSLTAIADSSTSQLQSLTVTSDIQAEEEGVAVDDSGRLKLES